MPEFILASNSPRRRELLSLLLDRFIVKPPQIDEELTAGEDPEDYVRRVTERKARAVGDSLTIFPEQELVVIAADTTVVDDDQILGKPEDGDQAREMLKLLRGKSHRVFSGLALYRPEKDSLGVRLVTTEVTLRDFSDQEIEEYISSGDPMDKAGAYAIQNENFDPVPVFEGCFANVMGLPLCQLAALLEEHDLDWNPKISLLCQESMQYECPVYRGYLPEHGRTRKHE